MFIFKLPNKQTVIYTGDLVLSPNWKHHKIWNSISVIDELIYDNTLCIQDTSNIPTYQESIQLLLDFVSLHNLKSIHIKTKQIGTDYCTSMLRKFIHKHNFKLELKDTPEEAEITILPTLMWFLIFNKNPYEIHKDTHENAYRLCWNTHLTNESFQDMTSFLINEKNITIRNMIGLCDKPMKK
jgi:hypothetical protein